MTPISSETENRGKRSIYWLFSKKATKFEIFDLRGTVAYLTGRGGTSPQTEALGVEKPVLLPPPLPP